MMERYYEEDDIFEAGYERGFEKGREEIIIKVAINMLRKGLDAKIIQECTKLSLSKIESIRMTLQ